MSTLPTIEGRLQRLDTALGMRKWVSYWARFEDDRLCFVQSREDADSSDFIDLNMVTSLKEQRYGKSKESDEFQIQISTPAETYYIMLETEDELARWLTAIRWRVDFFMSDRVPASPGGSYAQEIPGGARSPPSGKEDKQLFSISNSERQNQGFLKGYYTMLKNRGGAPAPGTSVGSSSGITSPRSGISLSDGAVSAPEINFGPTQTSPTRRESPSPTTTSPTGSGHSTPKPRSPSPPPVATVIAPESSPAKVMAPVVVSPSPSPVPSPSPSPVPAPVTTIDPYAPLRIDTPPPQPQAVVQQPQAASLEDRVRALEAENALLKQSDVGQIRQQFLEKENELKKAMAELTSSTESKKRSFTLIVASKDEEITKLRREAQQAVSKRVQELEEKLTQREKELSDLKTQRDREVLDLQQKLSDKELEVLELRERELSTKSKQDQQSQEALMAAIKKQRETEELLNKVKDRFFFSLAMNFKLQTQAASSMDLNSLYERVKREQVPYDKWQEWLSQRVKEITVGLGEDPEDARGF